MKDAIAIAATPDRRAQMLVTRYEQAGYPRAEPEILQPAEPFLDISGDDIRRRIYLTSNVSGRELCLRPDLTIPVSLQYLGSDAVGRSANFCYLGSVFGHQGEALGEFLQAGIASFGRVDIAAADAEMISLSLETTAHYGIEGVEIVMGDAALFASLIEDLDLDPVWKRRLIKDFNRAESLANDLDRLAQDAARRRPDYHGVLAALAGSDPDGAHALVTDLLSIAGITTVGGRSVSEIADRFLEQAEFGTRPGLPPESRALIERFLAIAGDPDEAAVEMRSLVAEAGLNLAAAIDLFESRTELLAARGVDVNRIRFSTAFRRGLDYYTGLMFNLHHPCLAGQLVAGGRYDGLLQRLGASKPIPAVGFTVWIDRFAEIGEIV